MSSRRKALMACANHWTSPLQVGSQHYARQLVRLGWEVAFVSDPISPLHLLAGTFVRERLRLYACGGMRDLGGHLWAWVPGTLLAPANKPLLHRAWVHRHWFRLTLPDVVAHVRRRGFAEVDLLYVDSPLQHFWLDRVRARRTVFRLSDYYAGFAKSTPASEALEREVARRVDAVVYVTPALRSHVASLGPRRAHLLPNGVDFEHFARPAAAPADYDRVPRPIAVYLGRLAEWFDWRLLGDVASRLPEVSFVLVGPGRPPRGAPRPPNLHLLGPRPYASAPAYLQHADVGLMPFDVSGHPRIGSSQPLKLLQYLASGLPVVSTAWAELSRLEAPAVLCRSAEEFAAGVRRCLAQPRAVDSWRAYAAGHAWEDRARRLVEILEL